jgi:phosphatidylserine decarboxylase
MMEKIKKISKYLSIALLVFVVGFLIFYRFWFLRCPDRKIDMSENAFVSPANGEIVSITKFNHEWINVTKEKFGVIHLWTKDVDTAGYIISIQMNPTHVHYQRMPIDGKIVAHKHTAGSFNNAVQMSNDLGIRFENEHNEILLENSDGKKFKIVQIAGFVARRIVDFVAPGMEKKKGTLIGLIKLGSQITVVIPQGYKPNVEIGKTVIDGESVLAVKE